MPLFDVTFQDPFASRPRESSLLPEAALQDFEGIDWVGLNRETFERQNEVEDPAYFWEVRERLPGGHVHGLTAFAQYTDEGETQRIGPQFMLVYITTREVTGRGFLGMGSPRTKIVRDSVTMEDCSADFTRCCIQALIDGERAFLAREIVQRESSSFD